MRKGLHLADLEKSEILDLVMSVAKREEQNWGPRSVRCFINKYQLARGFLMALNPDVIPPPEQLVRSLVEDQAEEDEESSQLEYVCRQVR